MYTNVWNVCAMGCSLQTLYGFAMAEGNGERSTTPFLELLSPSEHNRDQKPKEHFSVPDPSFDASFFKIYNSRLLINSI
jgi:hypothetical protein